MTDPTPPRRIAPQTGPHLWTGAALSPADWMVPLGQEAAAEISAPPGAALPRLDPLLARIADRLAHGQGFALLRGLPSPEDPAALLALLGTRLGRPVTLAGDGAGPWHTEPCDVLLLLCRQATTVTLLSAAALHNALLLADRAALDVLYRPLPHGAPAVVRPAPPQQPEAAAADPAEAAPPDSIPPEAPPPSEPAPAPTLASLALPVFAVSSGVFAARYDKPALDAPAAGGALAALEAAAASPGLALSLPLRPGDLLCVNPFLVWASRQAGLASLPLLATPSRLADSPFAALGPAAG